MTFILAFGGTGAKVMESVTMLMAASALGDGEIVPDVTFWPYVHSLSRLALAGYRQQLPFESSAE